MKIKIPVVVIFSMFMWNIAVSQLSPGDLAKVHEHLEGTANCTKCHTLGDKVTNDKCLDCHKEIKARIDLNKGYHSSEEVRNKDCFICHNDHHGRNFQIIHFNPDEFNHNLTGYSLEESHANLSCNKCHKSEFISDPELTKKEMTYLGLNTSCLSCHEDQHQGTLSQECLKCHDYRKFNPAARFNHSNTNFPLKGSHTEVECAKCHKTEIRNGKEFKQYQGINYASCTSCHNDVHNNKFGQNCTECHTEESFHILKSTDNIDHNRTAFPLIGKHQAVNCRACHKNKYTDPLPYGQCMNCHTDYHEGQFKNAGGKADCSDCHDVYGFAPSNFSFEKHQETQFPLEGSHMATPCFLCHKKESSPKWQFRDIGVKCNDCHEDIHTDIIDKKYYPEASCQSCHKVTRWRDIEFEHGITGYKLQGVHREKSCRDCHFSEKEGVIVQRFTKLDPACTNCHKDIHFSQFDGYGPEACLKCHDYNRWKADSFNHNNTRFRLEGKHSGLACTKCHKEVQKEETVYVLYKIENFRCEDCH